MKPKLKEPGINLSTLKYDQPLSTFAFKFKLRRYIAGGTAATAAAATAATRTGRAVQVEPMKPVLKARKQLVEDIAPHGAREASRALRTYEWMSQTEGCEEKNYDG